MGTYNVSVNLNENGDVFKLQIMVASFMAISIALLFKHLELPLVLSQITAGIILGPSVLGHIPGFRTLFLCMNFSAYLEVYTTVGLMFHVFLVGVQLKPSLISTMGRQGLVIGISMLICPIIVSAVFVFIISEIAGVTVEERKSLALIGLFESMSNFSVVTYYLHELKIINSKFSRVAYSSSLVSNMVMVFTVTTMRGLGILKNGGGFHEFFCRCTAWALLGILVVFVLRPLNRRMDMHMVEGQPLGQRYLNIVILLVMCSSGFCFIFSIGTLFGPFFYGVTIPSGSRMGTSLLRRLEPFNTWLVMPIFYIRCGSHIDIFSLKSTKALLIASVILSSYAAKILGAFLPARLYNMPYKDALLLGLAVNAQGVFELMIITLLYQTQRIDKDAYAIITMSMVILTGASTPIVRNLYKSTVENEGSSINTIQHAQPDDHFRVLACIYNEETVPSLIQLLKSSNPTKYSPIHVSVVHLVNLVGIGAPVFIDHKFNKHHADDVPTSSHRIMKAFKTREDNKLGAMFVNPYTVVTPYATMYTDVYTLVLRERPNILIIPFHKQFSTGEMNAGLRALNNKVLDSAPCSVGILIERGLPIGATFGPESLFSCKIAVVFLGGADDREALAYAARMSGHQNTDLSVIRFLKSSSEHSEDDDDDDDDDGDGKLDDEMLTEFNLKTANNPRVSYIEEAVFDGLGLIKVLKSMENNFNLILLGRHHDMTSPLMLELTEWDDCSELGTMGDIFIHSNCGGNATILVLQQQRTAAARIASQAEDMQHNSMVRENQSLISSQ